jgi:beta-glucosidase-like glycosyl hydrolase/CubicO group peptidase (beta-lactamase class C family)
MRLFVAFVLVLFMANSTFSQSNRKEKWVDSVFNQMSDNERLGQLFMVAAYSNRDETHYSKIDSLIDLYKIGGLIFFQGGPKRQVQLINRYQTKSKTKLFIGFDGEWGLGMRLDSTLSFPKQMTLGATFDEKLAYQMGKLVARHCKRVGIHINFAPVVDVNVNSNNPVIGVRSFGENKEQVAKMSSAYMKGMQHHGIMACGKHFPGHGDTDADSHYSMPVISHSKERLNDIELYPFRRLIQDSLQSIMVAHIHIPALDNRPNIATTLSYNTVTKLLKNDLGFKGLIFTDALNMKGVSKYYAPGEVDVMALIAGNDILLFAEDVPTAINKINEAFADGRLNKNEIFNRVKKILSAKYDYGLSSFTPIDTANLINDLNNDADKAFISSMYEKAITVLANKENLIPIKNIESKFAHLSIGKNESKAILRMLEKYTTFKSFEITSKQPTDAQLNKLIDSLANYEVVIVSLHELNNRKKENYGVKPYAIDLIKRLQEKTKVIVVFGGHAYTARNFDFCNHLILSYEDNIYTQELVAQIIFGGLPATGKLPVSISSDFKYGFGIQTNSLGRLSYGYPENTGASSKKLFKIDSLAAKAIEYGATPGIQIYVAHKGKVIYQKSEGYLTYTRKEKVTDKTLYDLASVTKTAATMPIIMFLHDWNQFNPDSMLVAYLPEIKGTNKENIIIKDLMVHQAGLIPHINFWKKAIASNMISQPEKLNAEFANFSIANIKISQHIKDSIYKWIDYSPLCSEKADSGCYSYKYSDLGFLYLQRVIEKKINQPIDKFLEQNFYSPLGLKSLTYRPLEKYPSKYIAPTEEDKVYRKTTIRGVVNDQNAYLMDGVAAHAGLFGRANDLLVLGQMLLNGGEYGGKRFLNKSTIDLYSRQQHSNNRRALGWDRPFFPNETSLSSQFAYGHTGFTGTAWWIDPQFNLVVVILANRTYPFASNKTFTEQSFRTKILNAVYEAVIN